MKTILRNFLSVLRRYRLATALNVLGLSVAFAAFMVIMMQVDYDRSFDRCHKDADNIYRMETAPGRESGWLAINSRPFANAFTQSSPHILAGAIANSMSGTRFFSVESNGGKDFYEEPVIAVTPDFTDVFAFDMAEGSDKAVADPEKVLIPQSLARKLFGTEPATGKTLEGNGWKYTVGGVFKDFPRNSSIQNVIYLSISEKENINSWNNWNYNYYLRVDAPENMAGLFENFKRTFDASVFGKDFSWEESGRDIRFTPLTDLHFTTDTTYDDTPKSSRQTVLILFCIAFVIVAIAGINFTNFSTALAPKRIRSINTQKVLGGSTRVIRTALIVEAVGICLASFLLALGWMRMFRLSSLAGLVEADISPLMHIGLVSATAGLAVLVGVLAGIYPSWYVTSFPPALVLKGSFGLSPKGRTLRNALIGVQFIASFVLIIGASFMFLQNYYMQHSHLGYDKDQLIVTNLTGKIHESHDAFINQLKSFAGIEDVASAQFLLSSRDQYMGWGRGYHDKEINYQCLPVDPSFLSVLGIELKEGRDFRPEDEKTRHGAYIFNEKARLEHGLVLNDHIDSAEIIGFMPDVKFASFRTEVVPMAFYVWGTQNWGNIPNVAYIKVKAGSDLRAAMVHVQKTLRTFDGDYPFNVRFYDDVLNRLYEKERSLSSLITLFSLVAILISIVGVFGLVIFDSEYRRKEISIRKVFGSTTHEILALFNKVYIRILCICFIVAAPVAWFAVTKWLESFAYKTPMYWWVYALSFLIVAILTVATVTFQNWRAANMNPVDSLKSN